MVCIYCSGKTSVVNSRPQKRLMQVWRRRACSSCGAVFTTNELVELGTTLSVRSIQGRLKPFSRDKLFVSVLQACGHRKAAMSESADLTATIITKLRSTTNGAVVDAATITALALETLGQFDAAASVQYGAYHQASAEA